MGIKSVLWEKYITQPERFADLINGYVGTEVTSADKLEPLLPTGVTKRGSNSSKKVLIHDVIKISKMNGLYSIWGVENQENVNYKMVFRNLGYSLESYERQISDLENMHKKEKDLRGDEYISGISKEDLLYPVVIIVVYFGERKWDGAVNLHDAVGFEYYPEAFKKLIPDHQMNLLEVNDFPYMNRFKTDIYQVFGFLQRRNDKQSLYEFIEQNKEVFANMPEDAFDVICAYGNAEIISKLKENCVTKGGRYNMCLALDEMRKDAMMLGEQRGIAIGESIFASLIFQLSKEGKTDDIIKATQSAEYRNMLYEQYDIHGSDSTYE